MQVCSACALSLSSLGCALSCGLVLSQLAAAGGEQAGELILTLTATTQVHDQSPVPTTIHWFVVCLYSVMSFMSCYNRYACLIFIAAQAE